MGAPGMRRLVVGLLLGWGAVVLLRTLLRPAWGDDLSVGGASGAFVVGLSLMHRSRAQLQQAARGRHAAAMAHLPSVTVRQALLAGLPAGFLIAIVSCADLPRLQALFNLGFGMAIICTVTLAARWAARWHRSRHSQHVEPSSPELATLREEVRALGKLGGHMLSFMKETSAATGYQAPDLEETGPQLAQPPQLTLYRGGKQTG